MILKVAVPRFRGPLPHTNLRKRPARKVLGQHSDLRRGPAFSSAITRPAPRRPDDPAAKAAVTGFLDAIGYDTVDAGALGAGDRHFQFGTRAFVTPYDTFSDQRGTPAGTTAILAALDA